MVKKRLHKLKFKITSSAEPYQNDKGFWVKPTATETSFEYECRVEFNGKGQFIPNTDGAQVLFSYVIYSQKLSHRLPFGHHVEVYDGLDLIAKGSVKSHMNNQMNSRIWV